MHDSQNSANLQLQYSGDVNLYNLGRDISKTAEQFFTKSYRKMTNGLQ